MSAGSSCHVFHAGSEVQDRRGGKTKFLQGNADDAAFRRNHRQTLQLSLHSGLEPPVHNTILSISIEKNAIVPDIRSIRVRKPREARAPWHQNASSLWGPGHSACPPARNWPCGGHAVTLVDPTGPTPHSPASSRDISKVVRSEYNEDREYTALAAEAINRWLILNDEWDTVYHNVGVTLLAPAMTPDSYEGRSLATAQATGKSVEVLDTTAIRQRFPHVPGRQA